MSMSEIGRYKDPDGLIHWAASDSKNTLDKLADGSFVDLDAPDPTIPEPPRSGTGSGVEAWREYAPTQGVIVTDQMKRDDIMAAVDASREASGESEPAQHGEDHESGDDVGESGHRQGDDAPADGTDGVREDQSDLGR